jgi:hypothetical protein
MAQRHLPIGAGFAAVLMLSPAFWPHRPTIAAGSRQTGIHGRVFAGRDPLAGLLVTATLEAGGVVHESTTSRDGAYRFDNLPDGVYCLDFDLINFDLVRRRHVRVSRDVSIRVDVTVPVSTICDCIEPWTGPGPDPSGPDLRERPGQVVNEADQPLPHARLEVVSATTREVAYADHEGRFRVLLSASQTWPLTASNSGFGAVTLRVSARETTPITLRLPAADARFLADIEQFNRGCRCARDLFRHPGR